MRLAWAQRSLCTQACQAHQTHLICYHLKSCQRLPHKRWQLFLLVFLWARPQRLKTCLPAYLPVPGSQAAAPGPPLATLLHPMTPSDDTDQRLMALEIKASYSDDLLEQLNLLVYRQQLQIDALVQQLQQMHQQLPEAGSGSAAPRNLRDELPPHY